MKKLILLILLFVVPQAFANFQIPTISETELSDIGKEFGANFMHQTVSPPEVLGVIWGVEFGAVAAVTKSPRFGGLVQRVDPTEDIGKIGNVAGLLRVGLPLGFTLETTLFPSRTFDNVTVETFSFGVMHTDFGFLSDSILDLAVKFHVSASDVRFTQTIENDVDGSISFTNNTVGLQALLGVSLPFFKPYAGIGWASTKAEASYTATAGNSIFTFTEETSSSSKNGTLQFLAGAQLDLWFFHLAAEYTRLFGTNKFAGKVAFAI